MSCDAVLSAAISCSSLVAPGGPQLREVRREVRLVRVFALFFSFSPSASPCLSLLSLSLQLQGKRHARCNLQILLILGKRLCTRPPINTAIQYHHLHPRGHPEGEETKGTHVSRVLASAWGWEEEKKTHQVGIGGRAALSTRVERSPLGRRSRRSPLVTTTTGRVLSIAAIATATAAPTTSFVWRGTEPLRQRRRRATSGRERMRRRRRRRRVQDRREVVLALEQGQRDAARVEHIVVVDRNLEPRAAGSVISANVDCASRGKRRTSSRRLPSTSGCLSPKCFSTNLRAENSLLHSLHRNLPSSSCLMCGAKRRYCSSSRDSAPKSRRSSVLRSVISGTRRSNALTQLVSARKGSVAAGVSWLPADLNARAGTSANRTGPGHEQ